MVKPRIRISVAVFVVLFCSVVATATAREPVRARIEVEGLHDHPAYTHMITTEGNWKTLYIAGQTPIATDGSCTSPGDWRGQYILVMENLKKVLAAGHATFSDVTFIRRFVTSIDDYFSMLADKENPVADYFEGEPPASTLIEVSRLADRCYLMEFDLIAAVPAK